MELDNVRKKLIELEDKIIRGLCERSDYKLNSIVYEHETDHFKYIENYQGSYLDYMFKKTENVHSICGRYNSFDEKPFFKGLDKSSVNRSYEISNKITKQKDILNFNSWIKIQYLNFLHNLCEIGDDNNYGDTVISDIYNLQIISKRIHYGILVMDCKYKNKPQLYSKLLNKNDDISILSELKNTNIEKTILNRINEKAIIYNFKEPSLIVNFFKNTIIPMTIQIELEYLFNLKNIKIV